MEIEKSGWKTSEFWLSLVTVVLAAVLSSGIFEQDSPISKIIGAAVAGLVALGYSASRASIKNARVKLETIRLQRMQ